MESFNEIFSSLENYSGKGYDVFLYSDFAPLSLEFVIKEEGRFVLNGGFKYFMVNMMDLKWWCTLTNVCNFLASHKKITHKIHCK